MKTTSRLMIPATLLTVVFACTAGVFAKPLKVYIMAGQSNMQAKARVSTIERLKLTEDSKQMYEDIMGPDGKPRAPEGVYGVYFTSGDMKKGNERDLGVNKGPLKPGYGEEITEGTKLAVDYTFGLYMHHHLNEPLLVVRTAWGGRDLLQQFRPPSAGEYEKDKDGHGNPTGRYYELVVERVKDVLADPGQYHPDYNKQDGIEIAGFVWFQGFNDLIGPYPTKDGVKDYSEYSRLMACFIRDIRKDLSAPKMPFVIGVMGIDGPIDDPRDKQYVFREAQEAAALLPEFKGNVAAVRTEKYWDMELERIKKKVRDAAEKKVLAENPDLSGRALREATEKMEKSITSEVLTPTELKIKQTGQSDGGYHYLGSAYTYGKIGKAFAEAMVDVKKAN